MTPPTPFPTVSAVPPRTPSAKHQYNSDRKASQKEALLPTLSILIEFFWIDAAVLVSASVTFQEELEFVVLQLGFCEIFILMASTFRAVR